MRDTYKSYKWGAYQYYCSTCHKVTKHRDRQRDGIVKMKCLECGVIR